MVFLSYAAIPVVIVYAIRRLHPHRILSILGYLFTAFILACGVGHLGESWLFWVPAYPIVIMWKTVTAAVSLATVVVLGLKMPGFIQTHLRLENRAALLENAWDHDLFGMVHVSIPEGRFLEANAKALEFFERTESELYALTYPEITHPEDIAKDDHQWLQVQRGERKSMNVDKRYAMPTPNPDGSIRWKWGRLTASLVCDRDGTPLKSFSVIQDIDAEMRERERNARQLQELRAIRAPNKNSIDELLESWDKDDA